MQDLMKATVLVFLGIFGITALLTIAGLAHLWFVDGAAADLPYLRWLLSILVAEVIGVVVLFARRGIRYLPEVRSNRTADQTAGFMKEFVANGSSVTIVSNRLAWLVDAQTVQEEIVRRAKSGTRFEIVTSQPVQPSLKQALEAVGVTFIVTGPQDVPEARFTLINADRSGAEKLAIAKGTHPNHEITIFDSDSGPQIIGLAKDIVRKSRALANV